MDNERTINLIALGDNFVGKTSIIQRQDQQLELRLKQLDTEQNALNTEIEAVAKVVKDNIDKSFKTFNS